MDFTLTPEIEDIRLRTRAFVEEHVLPLEADPANFAEEENIPAERLAPVRAKARAAGPGGARAPEGRGDGGGGGALCAGAVRLKRRGGERRKHDPGGAGRHAGAAGEMAAPHRR